MDPTSGVTYRKLLKTRNSVPGIMCPCCDVEGANAAVSSGVKVPAPPPTVSETPPTATAAGAAFFSRSLRNRT
jgi:hypothetical protein